MDAGTLVHIAAATAGLSAVIAHSPTAFAVVKYLGAAYLLYLGARTLLRRASNDATTQLTPEPLARAFRQGMLVNVLNPKVALFFLAFLPQFIEPDRGSVALQTFILGLEFFALGLAMDLLYVTVAAALRSRVSGSGGPRGRYFTGAVYLGLAAFAASSAVARRKRPVPSPPRARRPSATSAAKASSPRTRRAWVSARSWITVTDFHGGAPMRSWIAADAPASRAASM